MTLSLSVSVRPFIRPSPFFLFVSLEFAVYLEVSWVFQGCFKGITNKFGVVSRAFQSKFKSVSRVIQGCFMDVPRLIYGSFKGDKRMF